ncbi:UNVERIFIED_CONTAM: hypothetical protein Slati_4533000 [Sesamum latifolium]|uniref:Uncharacterized protein n=1 Tax=Sesamum latifolium TaxID=2727402 RepID=A0AAW2SGB6_9LAMI
MQYRVLTSVSAGSTDWSAHITKHWLDLDNLTSNLISQCQGPQDALDAYPPSREKYVVSHGEDRPEKSTTDYVLEIARLNQISQH